MHTGVISDSRSRSILIYSAQIYSVQIQESAVTSRRGGSDSFCCTVTDAYDNTVPSVCLLLVPSREAGLVVILSFAPLKVYLYTSVQVPVYIRVYT